jgi:predicted RNA binding protein YcfA (HicA-like mRNA interferase family)
MSKLPSLRPQQVLGALQKAGFSIARIRGIHYQLHSPADGRRVTVPYHNRDLSKATTASILRQAGITSEEFLELL